MSHGTISGSTFTKYEDENQKLRIGGGSWSINLEDLPLDTKLIRYVTDKYTYVITIGKANKLGFRRMLGGEMKLVVPVKYWLRMSK